MGYGVVWERGCPDDQAVIRSAGVSVQEMNEATAVVVRELREDSHQNGNHLSEGLRCIDVGRIRFFFQIEESNSLVVISALRQLAK